MNAATVMRENKRAYGNILLTIRRAESLQRAIRRGYSREDIAKAVANYKQAAARSGPVTVHLGASALGAYGITQGKRAT